MKTSEPAEAARDVSGAEPVLEVVGLGKSFHIHGNGFLGRRGVLRAFEDVSLALYPGEVTALVGESGAGKSSVARVITQLERESEGVIRLRGKTVRAHRGRAFRRYVGEVQIVFQDPFSSLNPTRTVRHHLTRPMRIHHKARRHQDVEAALHSLLTEVSLVPPDQFLQKFPHELSGGQRQRVAVARALASGPSVLVADEPVSMLDVSIRLGVLNLLQHLASERGLAILYITHDIASARYFAARTLVMYAGQMVEGGPSERVTRQAAHPYTRLLVSSAPNPKRRSGMAWRADDQGDPPSLVSPPTGCRFHPRCPFAEAKCAEERPPRTELESGHWAACWLLQK